MATRRCEDCGRISKSEAGGACPYCGGEDLGVIDSRRWHDPRLHPPVLKLAMAFCFGLAGMQIAAWVLGFSGPPAGHGAPLWQLNLVVGIGMALYWTLRRNEGDFQALFIAAFGIFVLAEGLGILSRSYGIGALKNLSGVFRHAMLVFSSLSLTAGAADGPGHTRHQRVMLAAAGGLLFLSVLHLILEFLKSESDRVEDIASILVALSVAAYAAWVLWAERERKVAGTKPIDEPRLEKKLIPEANDSNSRT